MILCKMREGPCLDVMKEGLLIPDLRDNWLKDDGRDSSKELCRLVGILSVVSRTSEISADQIPWFAQRVDDFQRRTCFILDKC